MFSHIGPPCPADPSAKNSALICHPCAYENKNKDDKREGEDTGVVEVGQQQKLSQGTHRVFPSQSAPLIHRPKTLPISSPLRLQIYKQRQQA
jgi:hypothetical protein